MDKYLFQIGNVSIRWYSVLILISAIVAIIIFEKEGKRHGVSKELLFNIAFWAIIFGIIGARIYYVLFNFDLYSDNLLSMFKIWEGGIAIHGGIIAGIIVIGFYAKKTGIKFLRITDYAALALIIAQAIGRWGNFFNSEAHGAATSLAHLQSLHIPNFIIEGMNIGGIYYEPTFFYESCFCIIGFILLFILSKFKYIKIGTLTSVYLMYYGVVRFFIESKRTDSLMLGGFKVAQLISIVGFLIGIIMIMIISRKGRFEDLYNDKINENVQF